MIVKTDFLIKLKEFGLNTYEAKLWTALLSRGVSTAGELSDIANVPRSRSYDVLESLERKGFIIMKLGKPIKYVAVPPEEVLERVKKKVAEESKTQLEAIAKLKVGAVLSELVQLHKQGIDLIEPADLSGCLRGRKNLYNHFESMIKSAKKSIIITTTEEGLVRKEDALKPLLEKAKQRGVVIRIAAPITKENIKSAKELSKVGEVRNTTKKSRFMVIDEKDITFMLLNDKDVHASYDTAVWVNTEFFGSAFEAMFNAEWEKMKQI